MYNLENILTEFYSGKFVTFRPSEGSSFKLEEDLSDKSSTGLYFDTATPYVSLASIDSLKPLYTYDDYSVTTSYIEYSVVTDGTDLFESKVSDNLGNPLTNDDFWTKTNSLTLYHKSKIRQSVETYLYDVMPNKPIVDKFIFGGRSRTDAYFTENTDGRFVGIRFKPKKSKYLKFSIKNIGLQFSGDQPIELQLYRQNTLVSTFNYSAEKEFNWFDGFEFEDDWYYLGYNQTGLTEEAVNLYQLETFGLNPICNDYLEIQPFRLTIGQKDFTDLNAGDYAYSNNFGISLDISTNSNFDDFLIKNMSSMAKGIQLQYALDHLQYIVANPEVRSNRNVRGQSSTIDKVMFEISDNNHETVISRLKSEKSQIKKSFDNISFNDKSFQKNLDHFWGTAFS
jgi:hypothetical protein